MTLRDVAKLAGVAPITASRAINKPEQVSGEVLRKVTEAILRTGYVPNRTAGGLASSLALATVQLGRGLGAGP